METLATRLRFILYKFNLSQAEAAKRCGLAQQSLNYIIRHNLNESKLSHRIAEGLQLNPEWLIYGKGQYNQSDCYSLPVLKTFFEVFDFRKKGQLPDNVPMIFSHYDVGEDAFAFLLSEQELLLCNLPNVIGNKGITHYEYIQITEDKLQIFDGQDILFGKDLYQIYERRQLHKRHLV